MALPMTQMTRRRLHVLRDDTWPIDVVGATNWLDHLLTGDPLLRSPAGENLTPIQVNAYGEQVAGFYRFASYHSSAELRAAYDDIVSDVTTWLGPVADGGRDGTSSYWRLDRLVVDIYAHGLTPEKLLQEAPVMQVHINDTALAEAQEREALREQAPRPVSMNHDNDELAADPSPACPETHCQAGAP